jgi:hypothetical protein
MPALTGKSWCGRRYVDGCELGTSAKPISRATAQEEGLDAAGEVCGAVVRDGAGEGHRRPRTVVRIPRGKKSRHNWAWHFNSGD